MANERVSQTLMNAILALDSYNRGYNPGIAVVGDKIGDYAKSTDSELLKTLDGTPAADLDFYAVSYTRGTETVISYRGTDNFSPWPPSSDIYTGWTVGAGILAVRARQVWHSTFTSW